MNVKLFPDCTDCCHTLYFTVLSSSVILTVQRDLTGSEGGSVTLPDPVDGSGYLSYELHTIAEVEDMKLEIVDERFSDRILWNNETQLFEIKGLRIKDSGKYIIQSNNGRITEIILTVYGK